MAFDCVRDPDAQTATQAPPSEGTRVRVVDRSCCAEAAQRVRAAYRKTLLDDERLCTLLTSDAEQTVSPFSGATEDISEEAFRRQLAFEGSLLLELENREGTDIDGFCILRRLKGEDLIDALREPDVFGPKTYTTDRGMADRLEDTLRRGLLYEIVEMKGSKPSDAFLLLSKLVDVLPTHARIITKILHTAVLNRQFEKSTGNERPLSLAHRCGFSHCGSSDGDRIVRLDRSSPFHKLFARAEDATVQPDGSLELKVLLNFGIYTGETRHIGKALERTRRLERKETSAASSSARERQTLLTRRRAMWVLVGSALIAITAGTLLRRGGKFSQWREAADASRDVPDADELLKIVFPDKEYREFSMEHFRALQSEEEQRAYLHASYLRMTADGEKEFCIFPSDTISYCELSRLAGQHMAYLRHLQQDDGQTRLSYILLETGQDTPILREYPANAHAIPVSLPNGQHRTRSVNLDFLRRIRDDVRLQRLFATRATLAPWPELQEKLGVYARHYPGRFPPREAFWRRLVEENALHDQHMQDLQILQE